MAFHGSLDQMPLRRVLGILASGGHSGLLLVRRAMGSGALWLKRGRVVHAAHTGGPNLGEVAVRLGLLDRDRLEAAVAAQKREAGRRPLGVILAEDLAVPRQAVQRAAIAKIEAALGELLTWREATFEFGPGRVRSIDDVEVDIALVEPGLDADSAASLTPAREAAAPDSGRFDGRPLVVAVGLCPALESALVSALSEGGFDAAAFRAPDEAWSLVAREAADGGAQPLLVLDLAGRRASALMGRVRRTCPRLPVAALVPARDMDAAVEAYRLGVRAVLGRPGVLRPGTARSLAAALCAIAGQVWREAEQAESRHVDTSFTRSENFESR